MTLNSNAPAKPSAGQLWNAGSYESNAGFVPVLGKPVLAQLAPQRGERILDLGCGDGVLTAEIVASGAEVIGVDASPELIKAAQARKLDARLMDGQKLTFDHEFDAVFSNAAIHWMPDWQGVLIGVQRALKPGGRFVGEFGGHGNVAAIVTALIAALHARGFSTQDRLPWFFPTAAEYRAALLAHGFEVTEIALIPRPTPLPTGMHGWLATFANPFLTGLAPEEAEAVINDAIAALTPSLCDSSGHWTADYVRLRFSAISIPK